MQHDIQGLDRYTTDPPVRHAVGLDPLAYLRDVLTRLPNMTNRQIPEVLPAVWAKTQQKKQRAIISVVA